MKEPVGLKSKPSLRVGEEGAKTPALQEISVVVYDFDGVLVDSREANKAYYNRILAWFGMPLLSEEQAEAANVLSSPEVISLLFEDTSLLGEALLFEKTLGNEEFIPLLRLQPHVLDALRTLHPRYRTAVASNRGKSLRPLMNYLGIEPLFDLMVGSADVGRPKPDPEYLERVFRHFNVVPAQVLYIGDSEVDLTLARRTGVPFVSYGNRRLDSVYYLDDHLDLLPLLMPESTKALPREN
jgi:HAD superfamily hydrolase (TIGR01509 family)